MARRGIFQEQFEADVRNVLSGALTPNDKPIRTASANAQQTLIIGQGDGYAAVKSVATVTSGTSERRGGRRRRGQVKRLILNVVFTIIAMVAAFLVINYLVVPHWGEVAEWLSHLFG